MWRFWGQRNTRGKAPHSCPDGGKVFFWVKYFHISTTTPGFNIFIYQHPPLVWTCRPSWCPGPQSRGCKSSFGRPPPDFPSCSQPGKTYYQVLDLIGAIVWKGDILQKDWIWNNWTRAAAAAGRVTSYFETVCIAIIHHPPPPQILLHLLNKYSYFKTNKSPFLKKENRANICIMQHFVGAECSQDAIKNIYGVEKEWEEIIRPTTISLWGGKKKRLPRSTMRKQLGGGDAGQLVMPQ